MSVARFSTETPEFIPDGSQNTRTLIALQAVRIEVADTGAAGSVNTIHHGLGRLPIGYRLIRVELPAGAGTTQTIGTPYAAQNDAWNLTDIELRFGTANLHVLLEIF